MDPHFSLFYVFMAIGQMAFCVEREQISLVFMFEGFELEVFMFFGSFPVIFSF